MEFKNPQILYFLFLLVIPILVHLFQLRRFKKEYFTNVRFLRELSIQTRKSSKLKKYLLLATRLLLLAAIVFAFAQPFFAAKESGSANPLFIVLDNSYSMQARGKEGELLKRSIEDLLEAVPENQTFSLLANDKTFWDADIKTIRQDLQQLEYSAHPFSLEAQMAKINARRGPKDIIIITDTKGVKSNELGAIDSLATVRIIVPKAEQRANVCIDSVYIEGSSNEYYDLAVQIRSTGDTGDVPVALHDRGRLIAKTIAKGTDAKKIIKLVIPKTGFHGYASVEDNGVDFDNKYFFSLATPVKSKVLSIGDDQKSAFMSRIFTADEFEYSNLEMRSLDYNAIGHQDVVILNELTDVPAALVSTLDAFSKAGGTIVAIPSIQAGHALNGLLSKIGTIQLGNQIQNERQVTRISLSHPVFAGVFQKKIDNFQYPIAKSSYKLKSHTASALAFESGDAFLASEQRGFSNIFVFAAPLSRENGNFQLSPLIVPTFYNMARVTAGGIQARRIGDDSAFMTAAPASTQGVLEVRGDNERFIPIQQMQGGKARLTFADNPTHAGNFEVYYAKESVATLSFNYDRAESFTQADPDIFDGFEVSSSAAGVFDALEAGRTGTEIWKWFVILALLFAACELLIQKFVK